MRWIISIILIIFSSLFISWNIVFSSLDSNLSKIKLLQTEHKLNLAIKLTQNTYNNMLNSLSFKIIAITSFKTTQRILYYLKFLEAKLRTITGLENLDKKQLEIALAILKSINSLTIPAQKLKEDLILLINKFENLKEIVSFAKNYSKFYIKLKSLSMTKFYTKKQLKEAIKFIANLKQKALHIKDNYYDIINNLKTQEIITFFEKLKSSFSNILAIVDKVKLKS